MFGDADALSCVKRLRAVGVREIVVKLGAGGCLVAGLSGEPVPVPAVPGVTVVDTTAAGDAFNGGYLAARLRRAAGGGARGQRARGRGRGHARGLAAAGFALGRRRRKMVLWLSDQISYCLDLCYQVTEERHEHRRP